jgi:NAD(P)-dependent dehydrogenase (short-subunit alcohol dehydrogenase family)
MEGDFERASFYTLGRGCEAHMHNVYEEPSHRGAADDGGEQHLVLKGASDDVLEEMVTINLLAPARLIQAAFPCMKHDGSAAIVNSGSIAGEMGTNGMYSATKFGLCGRSRLLTT